MLLTKACILGTLALTTFNFVFSAIFLYYFGFTLVKSFGITAADNQPTIETQLGPLFAFIRSPSVVVSKRHGVCVACLAALTLLTPSDTFCTLHRTYKLS